MGIYTNMMKERANAVKGLASSVTGAGTQIAKGLSKGSNEKPKGESATEEGNVDTSSIQSSMPQQTQRMDFDDKMAKKAMSRSQTQMGYLDKRSLNKMMKNDRDDNGGLI